MADVITRFKLETSQYDSKLRDASKNLAEYANLASLAGKDFDKFTKSNVEAARGLGNIATSANNAKDKVKELVGAYNAAANAYNTLSREQQQSDWGKALAESIQKLKGRISEAKQDLYGLNDAIKQTSTDVGGFDSVLKSLGGNLGMSSNLLGFLTSGTFAYTAAIGAASAAVGSAAKAWAEYNEELSRQRQIVSVTTGLSGGGADSMMSAAEAISDVYGADFREVINAANTLMSQFGKTGDEAIRLIRDGMQGMIMGDAPKLLSMIQQYAPAFRDAGVTASQLVAVIQNSEGGIFTDQNMSAIVFGIKNIRLMTKQTSEALRQLGIDGEQMSQQLNDGTITIFDALRQVADKLKDVDSNSQTAGQVMQAVFGRQGAMAGTNLAKAIAELNTNLEETKTQTGELGQSFADLELSYEKLNGAMRDTFGVENFEEIGNVIESNLVSALADAIDGVKGLANTFKSMYDEVGALMPMLAGPLAMSIQGIVWTLDDLGATSKEVFFTMKNAATMALGPIATILSVVKDITSILPRAIAGLQGFVQQRIDAVEFIQFMNSGQWKSEKTTHNIPTIPTGRSGGSGHTPSPAERAGSKVEQAERDYEQALALAALQKKNGTATEEEYQKKVLAAQETLWKALVDAQQMAPSAKFAQRQTEVEALMQEQGVKVTELNAALEARKKAEREAEAAARQQAAAEKKLTETLAEAAAAYSNNNLKGYLSAMGKAGGDVNQGIAAGGFTATTGNIVAFQGLLRERMGAANVGSGEYNALTSQAADVATLSNLIATAAQNGVDMAQFDTEGLWKKIFSDNPGDYIDDATWQGIVDTINEFLKDNPIKLDFETGAIQQVKSETDSLAKSWQGAGLAISAVGGALSQIQDPGIKIAGLIGQAIGNIALGFAQATAKDSKLGVFGWIAAVAGGLATMISTITAIKSATAGSYAEGGIIPGNSYSGDNQLAYVNAGEVILNRAQAQTIASELEAPRLGDLRLYTEVKGESLRIVLDNSSTRRGKGRYVTMKRY